MPNDAQIAAIFNAFDTDGDGFISPDELKSALEKGGKKVTPEQISDIVKQVDANNDAQISLDEFKQILKLAPDALPPVIKPLVEVTGMLFGGIAKIGQIAWIPITKSVSDIGKALDWKDTNVGMIGSDEDKKARRNAAAMEEAWHGCGQKPGVEIWRIESFKVVPWPQKEYGKFYDGDSYIVLHTHKENPISPKLLHDIYFWLGSDTSLDEMGTAAYKTVELDDLFGGEPVQHREVMLHESPAFKSLFKSLKYLKGGVKSAFNHVERGAHISRLLHVKKVGKQVNVIEVPATCASLNAGDAFVLDIGSTLYCWYGDTCSPFEKLEANLVAENLESTRHGAAKATAEVDETFWAALGGKGEIKSKAEAGEGVPSAPPMGEGVLYQLSDAGGSMKIVEVARGDLKRSMLKSEDVYVADTAPGGEIIVWVGEGASQQERGSALTTAVEYLKMQSRPTTTSITVLKEGTGNRNQLFKKIFD